MGDFTSLDPCVHCGFCLPACPTYLATRDEADSPRGRIVLMRALERGDLPPDDPALRQHLDACLGCRGCEPACPSGVAYGRGLEEARRRIAADAGLRPLARLTLGVFGWSLAWRMAFGAGRWLRDLGLAKLLAGAGRTRFGFGMLAATTPRQAPPRGTGPVAAAGPAVALFRGCVMDTLFGHVHEATRRTLTANGYRVVEVRGQRCCGALHDHAGDQEGAARLARANLAAFDAAADFVVVDSAGCGALLKDYGHLLGTEAGRRFADRVRDVTELLADRGPKPGGPLALDVAYDAPCHLQHAQRVQREPLAVLRAIPGLRLHDLPGSDRCCGSAGIYSLLEPAMSRKVLDDKIEAIHSLSPRPDLIVSGNPGCLMQIGAGLMAAGLETGVAHPIELLDWSYAAGGLYQ